jgi:hypothetical protein
VSKMNIGFLKYANLIFISILFYNSQSNLANAAACDVDGTCVNLSAGATQEITYSSICAKVTNSTATAIMIPGNTSSEWTTFLLNLPTNVTAIECVSQVGCLPRVVKYTATASHTLGTNCTTMTIEAWGGGGAGGELNSGTQTSRGTGGVGGYAKKNFTGLTGAAVYNITIGNTVATCGQANTGGAGGNGAYAGGAGGAATPAAGAVGTNGTPAASAPGTGGASAGAGTSAGGAGKYGGGGGGGNANTTPDAGGGGGGATTVATGGSNQVIAGGGGGGGGRESGGGNGGIGGAGCSGNGTAYATQGGGGGGGGSCYCNGGCTISSNATTYPTSSATNTALGGLGNASGGACVTTDNGGLGYVKITEP